jgi:hypothetical protein
MGHYGRWFMALFYSPKCFIQHASTMAIFLRKAKTSRREMTAKSQDDHGYVGRCGGRFVPETLMTPLSELEVAYRPLKHLRYGIEQSTLLNYPSQTMDNRLVTSSTIILRDHKKNQLRLFVSTLLWGTFLISMKQHARKMFGSRLNG